MRNEINDRFGSFMTTKFLEWQTALGRRATVTEFADALDLYQGDVSNYLHGRRIPGVKIVQKMAANPIIGVGIWQAAGYGRVVEDELELRTLAALEALPPQLKEKFVLEAERLALNPNHEPGALVFYSSASPA